MAESPVRVLDRYAMYEPFAGGGMAAVHFGRVVGAVGFSRPVAIKKLHPHFAGDPDFAAMLLDEARLAARVQHPNVVRTLDAVSSQGELFVILEYIHGESLSSLLRAVRARDQVPPPPPIAAAILFGVLEGLHAAHEARDARGEPLELVHRDVSPQNVLVGTDGAARVLDFGVAKARGRSQVTREGEVKGKLAYMAPEHVLGNASRRSDVFAAAICLWEALTAARLFSADDEGSLFARVMHQEIDSPQVHVPDLPPALVAVVMRGLERDASKRYATAREMAEALQASTPLATPIEVGAWVLRLAGPVLAGRAARVAAIEQAPEEEEALAVDVSAARVTPPPSRPRDPFETVPEGLSGVAVLAGRGDGPLLPESMPGVSLASATPGGLRGGGKLRVRLALLGSVVALTCGGALGTWTTHRAAEVSANAQTVAAPALSPMTAPSFAPAASAASTATAAVFERPETSDAPVAHAAPTVTPVPRVTRARGAKKADCSPAYTVDALGLRHYKSECF
jgi:hypothetical protein